MGYVTKKSFGKRKNMKTGERRKMKKQKIEKRRHKREKNEILLPARCRGWGKNMKFEKEGGDKYGFEQIYRLGGRGFKKKVKNRHGDFDWGKKF
jgi:hypothetical protein